MPLSFSPLILFLSNSIPDAGTGRKEEVDDHEEEQCPARDRGGLAEIAARKEESKGDRLGVEVSKSAAVYL